MHIKSIYHNANYRTNNEHNISKITGKIGTILATICIFGTFRAGQMLGACNIRKNYDIDQGPGALTW